MSDPTALPDDSPARPDADVVSGAHVVVSHDGHSAAHAALAVAVDLSRRIGAQLHVVHSVTIADYGVDPDTEAFERKRDENFAAEREAIADALAETPIQWTYLEARGDPADRLATLAQELDAVFIVVGATHRGLLHLGGSVANRLVRHQARPVVVVPDPRTATRHARHEGAGTAHQ